MLVSARRGRRSSVRLRLDRYEATCLLLFTLCSVALRRTLPYGRGSDRVRGRRAITVRATQIGRAGITPLKYERPAHERGPSFGQALAGARRQGNHGRSEIVLRHLPQHGISSRCSSRTPSEHATTTTASANSSP